MKADYGFIERLLASFEKRAEYYRTKIDDPYNMNTALYVAMMEAKGAIRDAWLDEPDEVHPLK